jgi:hypothetical protein
MIGVRPENKKIRDMTHQELASAPDSTVIAWNFIRIREGFGLTQSQTAKLGKVHIAYVGKIEIGVACFGNRAQQKWSKIFNIDRTEFLRRPDVGMAVVGVVADRGTITKHPPEFEMKYLPSLEGHESGTVICLRVSSDALYPHLRKDSYLYVLTVPVSAIRNDNLVICAGDGADSVKEVEWLSEGKILFKGLGRGSTITKEVSELTTVQKVALISM